MTTYTVVLLRPEGLAEYERGVDIYVAIGVEAKNSAQALAKAQQEALQADLRDFLEDHVSGDSFIYRADEYRLCVMFKGKHDPVLFGWQAY